MKEGEHQCPGLCILALLRQRATWSFRLRPPPLGPRAGCLRPEPTRTSKTLPASMGGGRARVLRLECKRARPPARPAPTFRPRLHPRPTPVGPAPPRPLHQATPFSPPHQASGPVSAEMLLRLAATSLFLRPRPYPPPHQTSGRVSAGVLLRLAAAPLASGPALVPPPP